MHRENALDANAKTYAADRERLAQQLSPAAHHYALEWLDALFIALAFLQAHVDANGVARTKYREDPCEFGTAAPYELIGFMTLFPGRPAQVGPAHNAQSPILSYFRTFKPQQIAGDDPDYLRARRLRLMRRSHLD